MPTAVSSTLHDEPFWRTAYSEHGPAVLGFLHRRLGKREEAEDLLQETFVRAIGAGSFRGDGNLKGYLLSIARNLLVNRLRRPRLVLAAHDTPEGEDAIEAQPSTDASPEDRALWSGFRRELARVLAAMSEAHRRAFELAVVEQRSYQEVTRLTGWSLAQVKVNVFRARQRILAEIGDHVLSAEVRR